MPSNPFSSKDLRLLDIIGASAGASQRELAEKSGLSLGMVNLVVRRLAHTGYIKVASLDRRKMSYLLTPKGLAEKSRRSYNYFLRTIRIYERYREQIDQLIEEQIRQGHHRFAVYGEGDFADMVKVILQSKRDAVQFETYLPPRMPPSLENCIVLNCCLEGNKPLAGISILENILGSHEQIPQGELHELV